MHFCLVVERDVIFYGNGNGKRSTSNIVRSYNKTSCLMIKYDTKMNLSHQNCYLTFTLFQLLFKRLTYWWSYTIMKEFLCGKVSSYQQMTRTFFNIQSVIFNYQVRWCKNICNYSMKQRDRTLGFFVRCL